MKLFCCFIGLLFTIFSCSSSENEPTIISENAYGKISFIYSEYEEQDSLIYITTSGDRYAMKLEKGQKFPFQYKNYIGFSFNDSIQLVDLVTGSNFFIQTAGTFFTTTFCNENDGFLLMTQYNRINVIDVARRKVVAKYELEDFKKLKLANIENATICESDFYIVVSHVVDDKQGYSILKTNLKEKQFSELSRFDEIPEKCRNGWGGMKIVNDVIFLKSQGVLCAIDKNNGERLDSYKTNYCFDYKGVSQNEAIFEFENQKIKFDFGRNKFQ